MTRGGSDPQSTTPSPQLGAAAHRQSSTVNRQPRCSAEYPPAPSPQSPAPRVSAPNGTTADEHEALCRRCGKCCYRKVLIGSTAVITPFPCDHLDLETHTCSIYARRKELNPSCLTVAEGLKRSAFPADCPYVARLAPPGYRPAVDTWSWDGQWGDFDELADDLQVPPATREKIRARGVQAPPLWVEFQARRAQQEAQ